MSQQESKILGRIMITASLISPIFYGASFPYINAEIISNVGSDYIAVKNMILYVGAILVAFVYGKYRNEIFKHYNIINAIEIIAEIIIVTMVLLDHMTLTVYFLADALIAAFLIEQLRCGGSSISVKVFNTEDSRVSYDMASNIVVSVGGIIGSLFAVIFVFSFKIMLIVGTIGGLIDNILYAIIVVRIHRIEKAQIESIDKGV